MRSLFYVTILLVSHEPACIKEQNSFLQVLQSHPQALFLGVRTSVAETISPYIVSEEKKQFIPQLKQGDFLFISLKYYFTPEEPNPAAPLSVFESSSTGINLITGAS